MELKLEYFLDVFFPVAWVLNIIASSFILFLYGKRSLFKGNDFETRVHKREFISRSLAFILSCFNMVSYVSEISEKTTN